MNYLQRENLRLYLEWKRKFLHGFVEMDAWSIDWRNFFERRWTEKLEVARDFIVHNRVLLARRRLRLVKLHTHYGPVLSEQEANEFLNRVTKGA